MRYTLTSVALIVIVAIVACSEDGDPGPFVIKGWIGQCEARCDQMYDCSYDQLLFDHGDLDNCKGTCEYQLDYEPNLAFIEETPDKCLTSLYAKVKCVHHLGCGKLTEWKEGSGDDYPCAAKNEPVVTDCDGVATGPFLADCGYPVPPS